MAIKPPSWAPGAVPTLAGWEDPNTGELLVSQKHTADQISEFNGIPVAPPAPKKAPPPPPPPKSMEHTHEDTGVTHSHEGGDEPHDHHDEEDHWVSDEELKEMSKKELELLGREHGVELDRRKRKADLIKELKKIKRVGI